MTEFETATLAYQAATLANQATALAYQATALTYQYAGLWISGGVGAAQCLLIGFGLWVMHRSADRRDRQHGAAMAADAKRHEEVMAALEERHDADVRRHEEVMAALEIRHQETMAALSNN